MQRYLMHFIGLCILSASIWLACAARLVATKAAVTRCPTFALFADAWMFLAAEAVLLVALFFWWRRRIPTLSPMMSGRNIIRL